MDWISYLDLPIAGIFMPGSKAPKSSVKPECDVYLDDNAGNCQDLAFNTKARGVFPMDRPWNQDWHPTYRCGGQRVNTWREFQSWVWALRIRPNVSVADVIESNELVAVA